MKDKELNPEAKASIIGQIRTLLEQYVKHGISVNFANDVRTIGPIGPRGHGDYTVDIELGWSYIKIRDTLKSNLDAYLDSIPDKEKIGLERYYRDLKGGDSQYSKYRNFIGGVQVKNPISKIYPDELIK